jgi:hypothetical protein
VATCGVDDMVDVSRLPTLVLRGRSVTGSVRSVHVTCTCDGVPPPLFPEFATRGRGRARRRPRRRDQRAVSAPGDQKNRSEGEEIQMHAAAERMNSLK